MNSAPQRHSRNVSPVARFVSCAIGLLALCLALVCPPAQADSPHARIQLGTDQPYGIFVDESGTKTVDEIAKLPPEAFQPMHGGLSLSYTRSAVWLRFERPPGGREWWLELQPAVLDLVQLYEATADGWHMRQAGDRLPYRERELAHRLFAFHLGPTDPAATASPLYLRIKTTSSLYLIANLRSPEAFIEESGTSALYWGLYFGALAVALLFMLAMVAINRSRPYLAISVALLVNGLYVANAQGFLAGTLWLDHPRWGDASIGVLAPWTIASMLWTLREFVTRRAAPPWLDHLYFGATVYCMLVPASLLVDRYGPLIRCALVLNLAAAITALLLQLRRTAASHSRSDYVLCTALLLYLVGLLSGVLPLLGIIQASPAQLLLRNGLFVVFALLAGGALLQEIRQTYWNLLAEKSRALETATQTERLLESCVAERTQALAIANNDLASRQTLLQQILDTSFVAIFLVNKDGRIALANRRMAEMFQLPMDRLVGSDYADLVLATEREPARQRVRALLANEIPSVDFDRLYLRADGSKFWGHLTCRPFDRAGPEDTGVIGVIADISQRKEIEEHERFRSRILEMLAGGAPLPNILTAMITGIEQLHPAMRCSVLQLDSESKRLGNGIAPSLPDFYNAANEGLEIGVGVGSCGTAAFTGERVIVEDIATHPYWAPYRDLAARAGLGACWSQPIRSASQRILGTLAIYHREPHTPSAADIALIEQMARLASIAIEKSQAESRLRDSEERYRLLIESSAEGICVAQDGFIRFCNPALATQLGYTEKELLARPFADFVVSMDEPRPFRLDADEAGSSGFEARHSVQIRTRHQGTRWFDVGTAGIRWNEQPATLNFFIDTTERKQAEDALRESQVFVQDVLDSVPNEIAVLDHAGMIVMVNQAWRQFATRNGSQPGQCEPNTGVGASYLAACSAPAEGGTESADDARAGIQATLDGQLSTFSLEYPCHSAQEERWFMMTVSPLGAGRRGAVVVHSDISERKRIEEQIRKFAYYDSLTQLANRRLLHDRLAQAQASSKRSGLYGALILLDLDNFKPLNDEHGHAVGDLLLIEVAQRLSRSVRAIDTVARLGGDEFVIVLSGLDANQEVSRLEALAIAEKIRQALALPYLLPLQADGGTSTIEHHCSSSIGVALFHGLNYSQNEILKSADIAMYRAKLAGRNTVHLHESIPLPAAHLPGCSL